MVFQLGNKLAEKRSKEEYIELFKEMYEAAKENKEILSLPEIRSDFILPRRTFYWAIKQYEECSDYHEAMNDLIIARVNNRALNGEAPPAAAIWRMKQSGEVDSSAVNLNHSGGVASEHVVTFKDFSEKEE